MLWGQSILSKARTYMAATLEHIDSITADIFLGDSWRLQSSYFSEQIWFQKLPVGSKKSWNDASKSVEHLNITEVALESVNQLVISVYLHRINCTNFISKSVKTMTKKVWTNSSLTSPNNKNNENEHNFSMLLCSSFYEGCECFY